MNYLIDTCVISELIKPKPNASCVKWMKNHDESSYFISVLTVGEIKKGISKLTGTSKRSQLERWFDEEFTAFFSSRILPIDEAVASTWGELIAASESTGKIIPTIDSLIGATASFHHLTIVTRNVKDFANLNIPIINPWVLG